MKRIELGRHSFDATVVLLGAGRHPRFLHVSDFEVQVNDTRVIERRNFADHSVVVRANGQIIEGTIPVQPVLIVRGHLSDDVRRELYPSYYCGNAWLDAGDFEYFEAMAEKVGRDHDVVFDWRDYRQDWHGPDEYLRKCEVEYEAERNRIREKELTYDPNRSYVYSRCSVGKNKWLWIVYEETDAGLWAKHSRDGRSFASVLSWGYSASAAEAEVDAQNAGGERISSLTDWKGRIKLTNAPAKCFASELKEHRRLAKKSSSTAASPVVGYMYSFHRPMDWYSESVCAHRIVRETKKMLYVEEDSCMSMLYRDDDGATVPPKQWTWERYDFRSTKDRIRRVRKDAIREDGTLHIRGAYRLYYTQQAFDEWITKRKGEFAEGVDAKQRSKAEYYAHAIATHPDLGGSAEAFREMEPVK